MVPKALKELVQCDAIGARGSAVRFDFLPSHFEISIGQQFFLSIHYLESCSRLASPWPPRPIAYAEVPLFYWRALPRYERG